MSGEAVAGLIAFAVFFIMWVVVPNLVHKGNNKQEKSEMQGD